MNMHEHATFSTKSRRQGKFQGNITRTPQNSSTHRPNANAVSPSFNTKCHMASPLFPFSPTHSNGRSQHVIAWKWRREGVLLAGTHRLHRLVAQVLCNGVFAGNTRPNRLVAAVRRRGLGAGKTRLRRIQIAAAGRLHGSFADGVGSMRNLDP